MPLYRQAIPGVLEYEGARIQLLDLPGIVEGASQGRGRGRQVVATAKTADLILIMLDATKSDEQRRLLEIELDAVGIRLNKQKPDVVFKRKTTGGVRSAPAAVTSLPDASPVLFCADYGGIVQPGTPEPLLIKIQINKTVPLTRTDEKTIRSILASCTWTLYVAMC